MTPSRKPPRNVDEYIAGFPPPVGDVLRRIRAVIRKAAPGAEEAIRYGIPTFILNGPLVHFAAYKNHIGFYPTPSGIEAFREELSGYECAKGTVRFPLDGPVPFELIERIVRFRAGEAAGRGGLDAVPVDKRRPGM